MVRFGLMMEPVSTECYSEEQCPAIKEITESIPTVQVAVLENGEINASCGHKYYQMAQARINQICKNCDKRQK